MRLKSFFFLFFLIGALGFTQAPEKFTYQSVIKNSSGYLLKNQEIGLRISILFNSSNGMSVYSEEHSVESNSNGLVTLIIGEGVTSDVFNDIDWGNGEYYLKVEVDPEGGINYTMNQTSQLLSVPYALYAGNTSVNLSVIGQSYITYSGNKISANKIDASNDITGLSAVAISGKYDDLADTPTLFDGDYAKLTNTPTLFDGDYVNLTNKPTLFDGDYANLTNTPTLFDGDYTNLTNKPTLFDGDYANLTNKPTLFDGDYTNLTNKPTLFDGDYANLTNTPTLFDGDYANLTNTPTLFDGDYANLTNKPTLFDGDYTNLTNKPELEEGKIYMGDSDNSPTEVAVTGDVTLANNGAVTIADDAVTNAKIANATIDLAAKVTGVLPIAQGGTGANSADGARTSFGFISGTLVWSNKDSGSGATATFSVSGISASSIVTGAIKSGGNNTNIYSITPNTDEITFTLSGTPSSSAVIMYISIN